MSNHLPGDRFKAKDTQGANLLRMMAAAFNQAQDLVFSAWRTDDEVWREQALDTFRAALQESCWVCWMYTDAPEDWVCAATVEGEAVLLWPHVMKANPLRWKFENNHLTDPTTGELWPDVARYFARVKEARRERAS